MMVVNKERQALLTASLKDHQCSTRTRHLDYTCPQSLPDASAYMSNVDTRREFQKPLSQIATESCGAGGKDNDSHGPGQSHSKSSA